MRVHLRISGPLIYSQGHFGPNQDNSLNKKHTSHHNLSLLKSPTVSRTRNPATTHHDIFVVGLHIHIFNVVPAVELLWVLFPHQVKAVGDGGILRRREREEHTLAGGLAWSAG